MAHTAFTLWLTGLSGSGKSTVANLLATEFSKTDKATIVLDGDILRKGVNSDLGFTKQARSENNRRAAEMAALINEAKINVIVSLISPLRSDRQLARKIIGSDKFYEVFVNTPLEVCEARDPKGLYRMAREGKIESFTGITAPYEEPQFPDFVIDHKMPLNESIEKVINGLRQKSR